MIASTAAHRQAAGLVSLADDGRLNDHTRGLIEQARTNPVRAAELITILAEMVAGLQPERPAVPIPELPPREPDTTVPPLTRYLRKAHAAYVRGCQLPWAIEGERDYQRLKKRNQRERIRNEVAARVATDTTGHGRAQLGSVAQPSNTRGAA